MQHILTAQADAFALALREAGSPRVVRQLEPGIALCFGATKPEHPIFLRHMCPATTEFPLTGNLGDLKTLEDALAPLIKSIDLGERFSVQSRMLDTFQPAYKRFDVNTTLAARLTAFGAVLDIKQPTCVVSVSLSESIGWIGISGSQENISNWAGGARRFKWEENQVSRAEFKLLEALETFHVNLPSQGIALDLGAAPGGWTRVLRSHGLSVVAVDPAVLDPRVSGDPGVNHFQGTAQAYFQAPGRFDLLVNDMKMDTAQSATLMVEAASCLQPSGAAIMTLKLPENTAEWLPRIASAKAILQKSYQVAGLHQLFHNRNEVTVYLTML